MRHRERPGKTSLFASAAVHVVALSAAWFAQVSAPHYEEFVTYQIDIVSPPPSRQAEVAQPVAEEELVIETPDPTLPDPEPEPPPVVEEKPRREEVKPEATPTPPLPDPEPVEDAGDPDPSDQPSGEDLNVHMEGIRRDYPAYWGNIISQMNRCMRFGGPGGLKTSVVFTIKRDGSVDGNRIEFASRSGNAGFDFAVMGAVECAGSGRFGPLPPELGQDRLQIIFEVTSTRRVPDLGRNTDQAIFESFSTRRLPDLEDPDRGLFESFSTRRLPDLEDPDRGLFESFSTRRDEPPVHPRDH